VDSNFNTAKSSQYNEDDDDILEDLYGQEEEKVNTSSLTTDSPNYFTNYIKPFVEFNE
jgi:hypothetical protein